jgi:glycosyltransferase 2 family protein
MKKAAIVLLKVAVTAGVLGWLLTKIEVSTVMTTLRRISPATLVTAAALVAFQPLVSAVRSKLVMNYLGAPINFIRTLQVYWIGLFAITLLPGGVAGDGVRMWLLARAGMRPSKSIDSVLLDRAIGLAGLLLFVGCSLLFVDDRVAAAPVRYGAATVIAAGIAAALAAGLCIRLPAQWHRFRVARAVANLTGDLRSLCRPLRRPASLIGLSALAVAGYALTAFVLLRGLGASVGLLDTMVLAPLVVIALTLPISLGGWGLREGSMVGLFGIVGVAPAVALSASILIGLLTAAVSVPGALVWLQWWNAADTPALT